MGCAGADTLSEVGDVDAFAVRHPSISLSGLEGDEEVLGREAFVLWLQLTAAVMEEQRNFLTELDAAIGDADHGINMDRGFKKVMEKLPAVEQKDIGSILRETALALISSVGGASGPLYGTFFLKAGAVAAGRKQLNDGELSCLLRAGVEAVIERGRAKVGDKTMVDALVPATDTLEGALEEGMDIKEALKRAVASAQRGMKNTIPMIAKKGRASYMGERSIGHQDPGATSSWLLLKALFDAVCS